MKRNSKQTEPETEEEQNKLQPDTLQLRRQLAKVKVDAIETLKTFVESDQYPEPGGELYKAVDALQRHWRVIHVRGGEPGIDDRLEELIQELPRELQLSIVDFYAALLINPVKNAAHAHLRLKEHESLGTLPVCRMPRPSREPYVRPDAPSELKELNEVGLEFLDVMFHDIRTRYHGELYARQHAIA